MIRDQINRQVAATLGIPIDVEDIDPTNFKLQMRKFDPCGHKGDGASVLTKLEEDDWIWVRQGPDNDGQF
jgi:hypothetical protein